MRVLFVEDDGSQIELLNDAVADWNGKNAPKVFEILNEPDVESAKRALDTLRIDAALFDLRLPLNAGDKKAAGANGGNDLAKQALSQIGVPIAVVSGNPADLDQQLVQHGLLRTFNKGDEDAYPRVLEWLDSLWTLMAMMDATRRQVQKSGAEIFARRLWPRWQEYADLSGVDQTELGQIISRQYIGHIAESLGVDGSDNVPWHPYEAYIQPALLDHRAHTGDIFEIDGALWIVLTPQCDMANNNVTDALIASVERYQPSDWTVRISELNDAALTEKKTEARDKFFRNLVNQNIANAIHFLPPLARGQDPLKVKFGTLSTRPLAELNGRLTDRVASVAPAFLPNLVQRFGAYISRTGQPDIAPKNFQ